jgi:hypothetical protein
VESIVLRSPYFQYMPYEITSKVAQCQINIMAGHKFSILPATLQSWEREENASIDQSLQLCAKRIVIT